MLDPSLVMTDVFLLSGILEFPFLSPLSFFCLVLLLFLSCYFFSSANHQVRKLPEKSPTFFRLCCMGFVEQLGDDSCYGAGIAQWLGL